MSGRVVIVDSGCANVASVVFAFERLGAEAEVTTDARSIERASHVVLPGVGAAPRFMEGLRSRGLVETVRGLRQPCLGICLGMQALFESSEEGDTETLGLFSGRVRRLPGGDGLSVPHMGWNRLEILETDHPLLGEVPQGSHAYFVHGYYVPSSETTAARTHHGVAIAAVESRDNFHGCQFHPERSAAAGARVLESFLSLS